MSKKEVKEEINEETVAEETRKRPRRVTSYERVRATEIPAEVVAAFEADDWHLRFVRFTVGGEQDLRSLSKREKEGYEYVTEEELIEKGVGDYAASFDTKDTQRRKGLLVYNDVVLMKADKNLVESRRQFYEEENKRRYEAADIFTAIKKHGFRDLGTKSKTSHSEPDFQN